LAQAISVNPGKPLAARGLRIQTVRPKWSTYALATANPNDVAVRIWFDATGRVTKATIIQSSGRDDVDRPILDAVYRWRATGERLSLPGIRWKELETPKSPRIVPAAALEPKVAPIILREMAIAFLPRMARTSTGEAVMNFTSPG